MKNKIIAILSAFFMLISGVCVEAVEYGTELLDDNFDSGFGTWTKEGNPTIENVKGVNAVVLGEKETVRYNPKSNELGWEDSYRATFRLKTKDWAASGNPTMVFRMKSQGNSQVYLIYYTSQGFTIQRLNPSLPAKNLIQGYSGRITADSSQWHDVTFDAIRNPDKSMTLKVYFDGEKQLEVTDTGVEEMPVTGGVMVGNWMKDNKLYVDSVKVQPIIIKNETLNPDDPAPDTIDTNYEEEATLLRMLGIMDNYTDKLFKGDFIMTRQEFVKCVVSMMGYDDLVQSTTEKCSFTDVSGDFAGYIAVAENLGIISGSGNDKFDPERAVTFDEAVKMLVCALGYNSVSELSYPRDYNAKAEEIGLLKHIGTRDTSRGTMSMLLVNALDAPLIELDITNSKYKYRKGDTILEKSGIYSDEGILTDNGITSYVGASTIPKDSVCIDHVYYRTGTTSACRYFGQKVLFYYKETDDDYELIYIRPTDDNTIYTIDSDDIDPETTGRKIYYYQNDRRKAFDVSPICNFIYNGKAYPDITNAELIPKDGNIVLIDNNCDKKIDTILISDYITVVAQYTSENTKTVYNMIANGGNLVLDDEEKTIEIYREDEKIDFSQIKAGDVIKAAISKDKEYIKVTASSNKISGMVQSSDEEGIVIDGTKYKIGKNLVNYDFQTGSSYLFRLDFEGRIAYAEYNVAPDAAYGYLKQAKYIDDEEKVSIKVFTSTGEWKTFDLAENVRFNNTSKKSEVICQTGALTPQLIAYTLNSRGLVSKIKTAVSNAANEEDINYVSLSGKYSRANRSLNSTYFLTNTVIFCIPPDIDDTGLYRVTDCEYLRDGQTYTAVVYNTEDNCPEAAVIEEIDTYSTEPYIASSVMLVDEVSLCLNDDNETVTHITGFHDGKAVEYNFEDGVDSSGVERGDVIQLTLNSKQEIVNKKILLDESNLVYKDEGGFFSNTRKVIGKVCKVYPSAKRFVLNLDDSTAVRDDSIWAECSRIASKIYVYDRQSKKASQGTFDDIEAGCDIFLRMDKEWIYDIAVYKN